MKKVQKTLSFIMAVIMLVGCCSVMAFAADDKITVSLRIEGVSECIYYGNVTVESNASVLDVIKTADASDDKLTVTIEPSVFGDYIKAVNGVIAGSYTPVEFDGWLCRVNGIAPNVALGKWTASIGDEIVLYYGEPYGIGMQYPVMNASNASQGEITFTSTDTVYEGWTPVEKVNTVTDYTLIWGYNGKTVKITPDENGVCKVPYKYLTLGSHSVQIERYDAETGLPTVLRLSPDTSVTIGFFDALSAFFNMIIQAITSLFGA